MQAFSWMRKLLRSERGNVLAMGAAAMPVLIGSAALAIDTIQLGVWKRELQRAADSAALAGAYAVAQNKPALAAATRDLQLNDQIALTGTPVVNNRPATGAYVSNATAVEVILESQQTLPFLSFFVATPKLTARSVAAKVRGDNHCLLALDPDDEYAIDISGSADLTLGCGIASNSRHARAAQIWGNATVSATGLSAVGGLQVKEGSGLAASARHPNAEAQLDPFGPEGRNLQIPTTPTACTATNLQISGGTHTLAPGRYCGGLSISGQSNVTFTEGGQYIFDGGTFSINGQANVSGSGVTLFMTGSGTNWANMHWNGGGNVNLSAPTKASGSPYAGVLIMSDPRSPASLTHTFNGNSSLLLRGALYLPNNKMLWSGSSSANTQCLQIVARAINITGNAGIPNQCTADDSVAGFATLKVRLVE